MSSVLKKKRKGCSGKDLQKKGFKLGMLVLVHITFDSGMNGVNSRSVVITTPTTMPE